jgi:hypothetical protein
MSGTAVPAIIAIRMRRYKEAFRAAGAISPATAIRPAEKGLRESLIFHKLVREGILVAAGNGRFYLDESRDAAVMRTKRKIMAVLVFIVLVVLISSAIAAWRR